MPTGYTATLMEKGQTFPEFVMLCARNFGALVMMRDEPWDAPIPEAFEPSDWNAKELEKARAELARLKAMTPEEQLAFGQSEKTRAIDKSKERIGRDVTENARLEAMEAAVARWTPPTADHLELKRFMLEQIRISKNKLDFLLEQLKQAEDREPADFYAAAVGEAKRHIAYHTKEHAEELERTRQRNLWVRQLRESLAWEERDADG